MRNPLALLALLWAPGVLRKRKAAAGQEDGAGRRRQRRGTGPEGPQAAEPGGEGPEASARRKAGAQNAILLSLLFLRRQRS